jgi:phosphoserine phosphatase
MTGQAAFFRLEGVLTSRSTTAVAAYLASHALALGDRLSRLGAVALSVPFRTVARETETATRLAFSGTRGLTEDRLIILGEEHYELYYREALCETGLGFLREAQEAGFTPVLISDSLDVLVQPLAEALSIDHVLCNRLEMRHGVSTGRLQAPLSTGRVSGQALRGMAERKGWNLSHCLGYGHQETDTTLLSALGRPCTLQPDRALRAIAADLDWPIVERQA